MDLRSGKDVKVQTKNGARFAKVKEESHINEGRKGAVVGQRETTGPRGPLEGGECEGNVGDRREGRGGRRKGDGDGGRVPGLVTPLRTSPTPEG